MSSLLNNRTLPKLQIWEAPHGTATSRMIKTGDFKQIIDLLIVSIPIIIINLLKPKWGTSFKF